MELCSRPVLVILLLSSVSVFSCLCAPPSIFPWKGTTQQFGQFFERALSLVSEVVRIMNSSENDEGALEYCTARLESLLTNCVNFIHLLEEGLYNQLIDSIQYYLSLLRSDELLNVGRSETQNAAYQAPLQGAQVGRPRYEISFEQLTFLVGEISIPTGLPTALLSVRPLYSGGSVIMVCGLIKHILQFLTPIWIS